MHLHLSVLMLSKTVSNLSELSQSIGYYYIYFSFSKKAPIIEGKKTVSVEMLNRMGQRIKTEDSVRQIIVSNLNSTMYGQLQLTPKIVIPFLL